METFLSPSPPAHDELTSTDEFKKWFGESRVRSTDGQPLQVYHGTLASNDFSEFTPSDFFGAGMFGKGINFTSHYDDAAKYASSDIGINHDFGPKAEFLAQILTGERGGERFSAAYREAKKTLGGGSGRVIPVYLAMNNPLFVSDIKIKVQERVFMLAAVEADLDIESARRLFAGFSKAKDGAEQFELVSRFRATKVYRQIASILNADGLIISPGMAPKSNGATHYLVFDSHQVKRADQYPTTAEPDEGESKLRRHAFRP